MKTRPARWWALVAACAVLVGAAGYVASPWSPARTTPNRAGSVVLATGGEGGLDHAYGTALAAAAAVQLGGLRTVTTAGSLTNLELLGTGAATFALAAADVVEASLALPAAPSIRAVARLYDDHVHVVVDETLPVHRLRDLAGLRVSVGSPGSGTALVADRILAAAGLDPERGVVRSTLGPAEATAALAADRIDAFFILEGLPSPEITALAASAPVRLVDLADVAADLSADGYQIGNIPAGTYPGQPVAVVTVATPTLLLTTADVDQDLVRRVTALVFDSAPGIAVSIPAVGEVDRHAAIFTGTVPLHDGARAYYRTTKVAA